jgi:hypothetical protein
MLTIVTSQCAAVPTLFEPLALVKRCSSLQTVVTLLVLHSRMIEYGMYTDFVNSCILITL